MKIPQAPEDINTHTVEITQVNLICRVYTQWYLGTQKHPSETFCNELHVYIYSIYYILIFVSFNLFISLSCVFYWLETILVSNLV